MFRIDEVEGLDVLDDVLPSIFDDRSGLVMTTLYGYFDESMRDAKDPQPICVAGYIFKRHAYTAFCRKWRRVLASGPAPTTHFHMTTLYARDDEYKGWSVDDRAAMLRAAVDTVKPHVMCGIIVTFSQSEFEQTAPVGWVEVYGSMYAAACQMVLRATAFLMDERRVFAPIAYIFESGHKYWFEADAILSAVGQNAELKRAYRYKTHFSLDKCDSFGLQAADMLSWIITGAIVGFPVNHTMRAFAPIIYDVANDKVGYQMLHFTGERLKRFFAEQISQPPPVVADLPRMRKPSLR